MIELLEESEKVVLSILDDIIDNIFVKNNEEIEIKVNEVDENKDILFYSSFLCIFSVLYAYECKHYLFVFWTGVILFNSMNYWRNPIPCFRKYFDMFCVFSYAFYAFYLSIKMKYYFYFVFMIIAFSCYVVSLYCDTKKICNVSIFFHVMIHVITNTSNFYLFKKIKEFNKRNEIDKME